jgi:hypothetical protein
MFCDYENCATISNRSSIGSGEVIVSFYLGLLETQGNQAYVFATNRERTARGASELLHVCTTSWIREVISGSKADTLSLQGRTDWLHEEGNNPWLNDAVWSGVSVVVATSGRAVLISPNQNALQAIVSKVTERALREAPGLVVAGAIVEIDQNEEDCFGRAQRRAVVRIGENLSRLPSSYHRFAQLPPIQLCSISGLPAQEIVRQGGDEITVSGLVKSQMTWAGLSRKRFQKLVGDDSLADNVDKIPTTKSWRAVVHADGNGVGKIFIDLSQLLWTQSADFATNLRQWAQGYRDFSLALEEATEKAFVAASEEVGASKVFPILLGGDDITVEVSADIARVFTETYLQEFEMNSLSVLKVLERYGVKSEATPNRLTAAAGIAVVKAHFPFHVAYSIAVELLDNAKSAKFALDDDKTTASTFDIHVAYDSSTFGLVDARTHKTSRDERQLWGGPYVVGADSGKYRTSVQLNDLCQSVVSMGRSRQVQAIARALSMSDAETQRVLANAQATGENLSELTDLILDDSSSTSVKRSLLLDVIDILDIEGAV